MKITVKLTESISVSFDNAVSEKTEAGTLIIKNDAGDEVGMYQAGTYLEVIEE